MPIQDLIEIRKNLEEASGVVAHDLGHHLHGFVVDKDKPLRSKAVCRNCGASVRVDAASNEVAGSAQQDRCLNQNQ